jgi:hypothetical protein
MQCEFEGKVDHIDYFNRTADMKEEKRKRLYEFVNNKMYYLVRSVLGIGFDNWRKYDHFVVPLIIDDEYSKLFKNSESELTEERLKEANTKFSVVA